MITCEVCNNEFDDNSQDIIMHYDYYICKPCYKEKFETCEYCLNRRTESKKLNIIEYQLGIEPDKTHRCQLDMSIIQLNDTCSHFDSMYNELPY